MDAPAVEDGGEAEGGEGLEERPEAPSAEPPDSAEPSAETPSPGAAEGAAPGRRTLGRSTPARSGLIDTSKERAVGLDGLVLAEAAAAFEEAQAPRRARAPKAKAKRAAARKRAPGGCARAARECAGLPEPLSADEVEIARREQNKWSVEVCGAPIPWEETPLCSPEAPAAAAAFVRSVEFFESATVTVAPPPGAGAAPRRLVLAVGAAALVI